MSRVIVRISAPLFILVLLLGFPRPSHAEAQAEAQANEQTEENQVEHLVPDLAENAYQMDPGPRQFHKRLSFSPAVGWIGGQRLYVFRLAYNPNSWLGYEASLGHDPGEGAQAVFHMLSAVVRYPFSGRFQPYGTVGYGMMLVFPGKALNADPVTENALSYGAGLEFYVRNDLAIRGEMRGLTVLGGDRNQSGTVAYNYREATIGFSFYRSLGG